MACEGERRCYYPQRLWNIRLAAMFLRCLARKRWTFPFGSQMVTYDCRHTDFTAHVTRRLLIIQSITHHSVSVNIDREI